MRKRAPQMEARVLAAIGTLPPDAPVKRIADATEYATGSVHHIIANLVDLECVNRVGSGKARELRATGKPLPPSVPSGRYTTDPHRYSKPSADESDPRHRPKKRKCLGPCGQSFMSQGAGNRLCDKCRKGTDWP